MSLEARVSLGAAVLVWNSCLWKKWLLYKKKETQTEMLQKSDTLNFFHKKGRWKTVFCSFASWLMSFPSASFSRNFLLLWSSQTTLLNINRRYAHGWWVLNDKFYSLIIKKGMALLFSRQGMTLSQNKKVERKKPSIANLMAYKSKPPKVTS